VYEQWHNMIAKGVTIGGVDVGGYPRPGEPAGSRRRSTGNAARWSAGSRQQLRPA